MADFEGGEIMICGGTDWSHAGKTGGGAKNKKTDQDRLDEAWRAEQYPNLLLPHRIKVMMGVKVRFIASGSAASHSIVGDAEGRVYTFGRNDKGQLGHGDTANRNVPTLVAALKDYRVIAAAAGKHHTAFVTDSGHTLTCGSNLQGQCGTGSIKSKKDNEELFLVPTQIAMLEECTNVACGAEFTMWLCDGKLWSAGMPQYGQLGHGDDHEHNTKDSSIKVAYAPQPTPKLIEALSEVNIVNMACGHNHTIALDDTGSCYSWGTGGYGRLGHTVQKDEFSPKAIETFRGRVQVDKDAALCAAGSMSSFTTIVGGQLYAWGKLKVSGDNIMYPKPYMDLAGWTIRSIACGNTHFAVAAHAGGEEAAIAWGTGAHGELGYGPNGKKSSANADKVPSLDGVKTFQVACGVGHTLFIVDPTSPKVEDAPVWHCDVEEQDAEPPKGKGAAAVKAAAKRKAAGAATGAKGKKKA